MAKRGEPQEPKFTAHELGVVRLLAERKRPAAIQAELGISAGTFKNRIKSLRFKLGLAENAGHDQIVRAAIERNLIESPTE